MSKPRVMSVSVGPGQDGVNADAPSGQQGAQRLGQGERGRFRDRVGRPDWQNGDPPLGWPGSSAGAQQPGCLAAQVRNGVMKGREGRARDWAFPVHRETGAGDVVTVA
jgi:hypothetical protein